MTIKRYLRNVVRRIRDDIFMIKYAYHVYKINRSLRKVVNELQKYN